MNRLCPECETKTCKIEFNTLLQSIYCSKCTTRFEYPASSKKSVRLVFSFVSFLAVVTLFTTENLLATIAVIALIMIPALYQAIWHARLKVAGIKGIRKRLREKARS